MGQEAALVGRIVDVMHALPDHQVALVIDRQLDPCRIFQQVLGDRRP